MNTLYCIFEEGRHKQKSVVKTYGKRIAEGWDRKRIANGWQRKDYSNRRIIRFLLNNYIQLIIVINYGATY